jgi:hypothetical protein
VPDAIQVSDVVRERLEGRFVFEPRGVMDLKGIGPTHTWLLRARRAGPGIRAGRGKAAARRDRREIGEEAPVSGAEGSP